MSFASCRIKYATFRDICDSHEIQTESREISSEFRSQEGSPSCYLSTPIFHNVTRRPCEFLRPNTSQSHLNTVSSYLLTDSLWKTLRLPLRIKIKGKYKHDDSAVFLSWRLKSMKYVNLTRKTEELDVSLKRDL